MVIAGPASTERFTDRAASYARARPGYPDAIAPMLARLRELFDAGQRDGRIVMAYDTRVFFGALDPQEP